MTRRRKTELEIATCAIFGLAGILIGVCSMSIHDHMKLEQDRIYYSAQRFDAKFDSEKECADRIAKLMDRCRCEIPIK